MKTAIYNTSDLPFEEWLTMHLDADCIELEGLVSIHHLCYYNYDYISKLTGKIIDITRLKIDIKTRDDSDYLCLRFDIIFWGCEQKMPWVIILLLNRIYTKRFLITPEYIMSEDNKTIIRFLNPLADLVIPNGVERIGNYACFDFENVHSVSFPQSLDEIGGFAFTYCEKLKTVHFPDRMTVIGRNCFMGTDIEHIELPEGLTELPKECFRYCPISYIKLPTTLKRIRYYALNCREIVIPEGVETIYSSAIMGVRKIDLPSTLKFIAKDFYYDSFDDKIIKPTITLSSANPYYYQKQGKHNKGRLFRKDVEQNKEL